METGWKQDGNRKKKARKEANLHVEQKGATAGTRSRGGDTLQTQAVSEGMRKERERFKVIYLSMNKRRQLLIRSTTAK